jgi:two-component system, chemotaxis family, sensor histidine kinase and response regulator WspE
MTPDEMKDASMLELFRFEAEAQTQVLNTSLLILEREPTHAEHLEACMRAAHSLKGAARIVGVDAGVRVAHVMEDMLVAAQEGQLLLRPEHIDALLQGSDLLLRVGCSGAEDAAALDVAVDTLVKLLEALLSNGPLPAAPPPVLVEPASIAVPALAESSAALLAQSSAESLVAAVQIEPAKAAPASAEASVKKTADEPERVLRVTAERLDHLLDISSKSLVEFQRRKSFNESLQQLKRMQGGVRRELDALHEHTLGADFEPKLQALLLNARKMLGECQQQLTSYMVDLDDFTWQGSQRARLLYDAALASRMRPFGDILPGQVRMVRDLARTLGKQVRIDVFGETTQVDRDVLEKLEAPLTHLLRNAVDHGIESPEERMAQGKPAEGALTLRARQHAGMLILELSDDGNGVDLERVRRAVLKRKLANEETTAKLNADELLAFLFLPGFSMREEVTEISGRGVGLDAVQHMARQLRGAVRMEQQPGCGTKFILEVPLTLSVIRSLIVEIGGEAYAFPMAHIERMVRLQPEQIVQLEGRQHFWYEGEHVGLVAGSQLLQQPDGKHEEQGIAVVLIRDRESICGIAVERFVAERTLVLVPLDPCLGKIKDLTAGALMDDGTPVLILDVEDLLKSVGKLFSLGNLARVDGAHVAARGARKRVLVVDDSLTVRELERKLLVGQGYEVAVAVDGMDGWNMLRAEHFDLLVTDVDMPRMDGIELVGLVRRDSRLQSLPVMVVSYKDREEDRRRGLDAGADYYLAKASFNDDTLLDAVRELIGEPIE